MLHIPPFRGMIFSPVVLQLEELSAPTVTELQGPGSPPNITLGLKSDHYAGYFLRIQRNADGAKDANGDYTNQTLASQFNGVLYFIDASDLVDGITNAELESVGYANPTGSYFQQYRIENENGQISPWVEISGSVTVSIAQLASVTSINKSQYIVTSGTPPLSYSCTTNLGGRRGVRATTPAVNDKFHVEYEIVAFSSNASGNGNHAFGMTNGSDDLNASSSYPNPGNSFSTGGCSVLLSKNGAGFSIQLNGTTTSGSLTATPEAGDIFVIEVDTLTSQVSFWHRRQATGTTNFMITVTLTNRIPANGDWHAYAAGSYSGDSATVNFGASSFIVTPTAGYSMYG